VSNLFEEVVVGIRGDGRGRGRDGERIGGSRGGREEPGRRCHEFMDIISN